MNLEGRAAPARARPGDLRALADRSLELPAMPVVATRVIQAVASPTATVAEVAALIGQDPVVTTWIMRVVNSAAYGRQRTVSSLVQAVSLLGFKEIKSLVISASMRTLSRTFGPVEQRLWRHAVCTALGARLVARRVSRALEDEAFLAGQLHDVGKIVLQNHQSEALRQAEALRGELGPTASEEHVLGFAHTDVGSLLVQRWGLPQTIEVAAFYHHDLELCSSLAPEHLPLVACVTLADVLAHRLLDAGPPSPFDEAICLDATTALGLAPAVLDSLSTALAAAAREAA